MTAKGSWCDDVTLISLMIIMQLEVRRIKISVKMYLQNIYHLSPRAFVALPEIFV